MNDDDYMWERVSNAEYLIKELVDSITALQTEIVALVRVTGVSKQEWLTRLENENKNIQNYLEEYRRNIPVWHGEDSRLRAELDNAIQYSKEKEVGDWI